MAKNGKVAGPDLDQRAARSTSRYRKLRRRFLAGAPLCVECKKKGIVRAAEEMDHITPAAEAPHLFWNEDNWQGLCRPCHERKTASENREESPAQKAWRERNQKKYG